MDIGTPKISLTQLKAERAAKAAQAAESGLYARIKATSEYANQSDGEPFPVALYSDGEYIVHGGRGGRYRLADVDLYWSNNAGQLFPCKE